MAGVIAQNDVAQNLPNVRIEVASHGDDFSLRQLLREHSVQGRIKISYEREPSFFDASAIEGDIHHTVLARESTSGHVKGMGSRSVRNVFINGQRIRVGYLSQLRVHPDISGRRKIYAKGYETLKSLRKEDEAPFDLTTIVAENRAARRILTAHVPGLPDYYEREPIVTLVIPVWKPKTHVPSQKIQINQGSVENLGSIADCLQRNYRKFQFAPCWTVDDLESQDRTPNLNPNDFFTASDNGRLTGCLALWDQTPFKQHVVRGYDSAISRWRPFLNLIAPWLRFPRLPDIGKSFRYAYLSHVAVDNDDPQTLLSLLHAATQEAYRRDYSYIVIGLAERHPWTFLIKRAYSHIEYKSILYLVNWDGIDLNYLDGRIPHLEIATL